MGQVYIEDRPHVLLEAADAKNREETVILLRADVAAEIGEYIRLRLEFAQSDARRSGGALPLRIAPEERLVRVPSLRAFDLDLEHAKIEKRDASGRAVDFHSLRVTFSTLLTKGGVSLRVVQAAMRHSDPRLTAVAVNACDRSARDPPGASEKPRSLVRI